MICPQYQNSSNNSFPSTPRISCSVFFLCRPLEQIKRMSFFSTPAAYSSFKISLIETFLWEVGCSPPFTLSGNTIVTLEPFFASLERGSIPIGFLKDSSVLASSSSSGIYGGSATVTPGINTSVLSGSSAAIVPCPYSNSSLMFLSLPFPFLFYLPMYVRIISKYSSG